MRSLCIFLPKMSAYRNDFHETKYMSFFIKYDKLSENYNDIWEKIKKEFDSEPVYNEKYIRPTIKSFNGKINKNVCNNKIPKEVSQFICLSVSLIGSVFRISKNYYPQVFLEKCKNDLKEKKIPKYVIGDIEILSDLDLENYDEEN